MPSDIDSARKKEILVDPFDLTFVWPLRLRDSGSGKEVGRERVKRALLDGQWGQVKNLVTRNGRADEAGYAYAEMVYFHPFVQNFLYGNTDEQPEGLAGVHHFDLYQMSRLSGKKLEIKEPGWEEEFIIHEVLFHSFEGDIALLTFRLTATRPVTWDSARNTIGLMRTAYFQHYYPVQENVWRGGGGIEGVHIEGLSDGPGQRADPQSEMRNALDHLEPMLYRHWSDLLQSLENAKIKARPLGDHRIPIMAFLGLKDPTCLDEDEWFALSEADSAGFPCYAPTFRNKALAEAAYDRWWDRSDRKLRHRYLAGPMTYFSVVEAPADRPTWFERIRTSWRRQHYQMFLLAHYQRAALLDLQDRIARAADKAPRDDAAFLGEIADVQRRMAVFSSNGSFLEISPQIQGQELYSLLRRRLSLDSLHKGVIDDKALLGNWVMAREGQRNAKRWEVINLWVIPLGLAFTFLGANVFVLPLQELLKDLVPKVFLRDGIISLGYVLPALLGARLCHWYLRRKQKGR
jgi:hypothetical protein